MTTGSTCAALTVWVIGPAPKLVLASKTVGGTTTTVVGCDIAVVGTVEVADSTSKGTFHCCLKRRKLLTCDGIHKGSIINSGVISSKDRWYGFLHTFVDLVEWI